MTSLVLSVAGLGVSDLPDPHPLSATVTLSCPAGGGAINCEKVTTSPQSIVFGIPVAVLGLVYFVAMLVLCLPAAWRSGEPTGPSGPPGPVGRRGGHDHLPDHRRAVHHQGHLPVVHIGPRDHLLPLRPIIATTPHPVRCWPPDRRPGTTWTTAEGLGSKLGRLLRRAPDDRRRLTRRMRQTRLWSTLPTSEAAPRAARPGSPGAPCVILLAGVIALVVVAPDHRRPRHWSSIGRTAPDVVVRDISDVSQATFDSVGVSSPKLPSGCTRPMHGQPVLIADGKPEVLYVGAEYCPFCAAERWPLCGCPLPLRDVHRACSNMQSSSTSAFPDLQTFSFDGASYTSPLCRFHRDRAVLGRCRPRGRLHPGSPPSTPVQQRLVTRYGPVAGPVDARIGCGTSSRSSTSAT